ncbi:MAG: HAD-IA family hydrolase [Cyanobacteria bacterium J06642_11]
MIIADDLPKGKPDPLPYQTALNRLAITAAEALVFEDSPTGVRAAVAAGIPTIGITSSHSHDVLTRLGAIFTITDYTDNQLNTYLAKDSQEPCLSRR